MGSVSNYFDIVESCYLPKLSRNLEECEHHSEFIKWELLLSERFTDVINFLNIQNFNEYSSLPPLLSSVLILYYQFISKGRWNSKKCEECAKNLDTQLDLLCETPCSNLLKSTKLKNTQDIFDKSLEILHRKLTPEEFKKYPALIEAYCLIINDLRDYNIVLKPGSVLPISLLLIEDYVPENRLKGLKSCSSILKCLTSEHFKEGNYYEVIYRILKKMIVEREIEVTKLVMECLFELLQIVPTQAKVTMIDDSLGIILEQMYTETNLYRKKALFGFINKIMPIHGFHSAKRTMFLTVICDNLDVCSNAAVSEILLTDTLECLESWIKYCWCVWKLGPNKKLMSTLIKMLYVCQEEETVTKIQTLFVALCKLCTDDEQKKIHINIKKSIKEMKSLNEKFGQRLEKLKVSIR